MEEPTSTSRSANVNFPESGEGTGGKAVRTSPHCLSESEFAGACAEQLIEVQKVGVAAKRSGVELRTARVLFFCERFLLHIKIKCSYIHY